MKIFRLSRKNCSLPISLSHFLCFLLYGAWTMTCNKPTDRIFIANPHVLKKGTKWVLVFSALFCLGWQRPQMHDYDPIANIPSFALSHFSFTWILLESLCLYLSLSLSLSVNINIINEVRIYFCREPRNEASDSEHFPVSAYARRAIIDKSI